jgi:hypothetical protein
LRASSSLQFSHASDHLASLGFHVHWKSPLADIIFSVGFLTYLFSVEFTILYELSFVDFFNLLPLPDLTASSYLMLNST